MTIKINPDLDLRDDAVRGFTTEQVGYICAAIFACLPIGIFFKVFGVPVSLWGAGILPVAFIVASMGFKQKNGMTLMEVFAKKLRLRRTLYYKSTERMPAAASWETEDNKVKNEKGRRGRDGKKVRKKEKNGSKTKKRKKEPETVQEGIGTALQDTEKHPADD